VLCKLLVKSSSPILSSSSPILRVQISYFLRPTCLKCLYFIMYLNWAIKDYNHILFGFEGAHIAVRDQKFALAVESCLKSTVLAFCCHDNHDQRLLLQFLRQCTDRVPSIIVSRFLVCQLNVFFLVVERIIHGCEWISNFSLSVQLDISEVNTAYRGYYMAAGWYEFYLRVLKVSLRYFQHEKIKFVSPSGHVMFCLLYRYWWNFHLKDNFFYSFSKQQKVVIYCKLPVTEMLLNLDIKL